jgi:glycosyltransferase involved in cell wall biosynthesis
MVDHTFAIPVYKESPYLEACIQSLLAQTVKSEIIIATSTPTGFTRNIADSYGITYHINDSGKTGIAHDWNFALSKAKTSLVTIAHQDDIYEPDYTQTMLQAMQRGNNQALIAFSNYSDIVDGQPRKSSFVSFIKNALLFPFLFASQISRIFFKKMIFVFGNPICCPSVMFNRERLGDFNFSTEYQYALDWYAWYTLAKQPGAFIYSQKKLIKHRIHEGAETALQLNNGQKKQEEFELFKMMWGKTMAKLILYVYSAGY